MKKLINKLFEWLGYVPKSKYEVLSQDDLNLRELSTKPIVISYPTNDSLNKINRFSHFIYKKEDGYEIRICMLYDLMRPRMCIKTFYTDDYEYAKLCAEELCEMLNQKI